MDELTTRTAQLPDTLEDLSQFVLVNKANLDAYRVKLRAINRLSDAQEIREQTLQEMQDISSALIAAETRIGEILLSIPKQSGKRTDLETSSSGVEKVITKAETISEMGYSKDQASDYQRMAQNPAIVNLVIEQAEREGKVVSHAQVMREIKARDSKIDELTFKNGSLERVNKQLAKEANQGGKVVEKVVEVEVVPDDYEQAKRDAEIAKKDFKDMQKRYEEMAEKWKASEKEKRNIQQAWENEKNDPVKQTRESALLFCAGISNFMEKYGGYIWVTEKLDNLTPDERKGFIAGINALEMWVRQMKLNVEGIYEEH